MLYIKQCNMLIIKGVRYIYNLYNVSIGIISISHQV